jgi:medium-chain acyl-[acyl-carrier-protein] hydrolase
VRAPLPERGQCGVAAGRSGLSVVLSDTAGNAASLTMEGLVLEELDEPTLAALQALRPAATASEPKAQDLLATLQSSVDPNERGALTREYLRREIARVSRARPEDISDDLPFLQLGIDSIMGLELRSRLETSFQLELPATVIYSYPDLNALSRFILEASGLAQDSPASDGVAVKPGVTERSSWILCPVPRGKQALRLLVFPFSGGTAAAYVHWASRLPDQIELCAVELPGRGFRFRQPAYEDFFALVDSLDRELRASRDQPFALFGHSMGAMVAFELARRWSADGGTPPQRLFVSGLPAPQWFDTTTLREALAEDRLLDHLAKWGAVAPAARDQDVLALGMPAMQADLRALASWSYREAAPLPCPITALRGTTDALTPLEPMQAWRQHTQSEFRLATFPGDHFYFQVERARLLRVLADDLLSTHALVEQVSQRA